MKRCLRPITPAIDHGLSAAQLRLLQTILEDRAPAAESVSLYGSRASGTYRSYSDIDLVLFGDVAEETIDRLWTCFHESSLPCKVDVNAYHLISYPPLKAHIDRCAKPLFSR